ncbi:protein PRY1-like isoform X2 [Nematostella vectensis]|uniref:protein PRY1-like isoform X2 n=1 Tax=Nematostella vectensis TaxID=45351 RepID=UPI0020775019|nr:protein PRY1-like isoform X2 [Nematostella vectensis]
MCLVWAKNGECQKNKDWMSANCKKSCNTCTNGGSETTRSCIDNNYFCTYWKSKGYCSSYKDYRKINCLKTCALCDGGSGGTGPCKDSNQMCPQWATNGECSKNPDWMKANCAKSCNSCGGGGGRGDCTDSQQMCLVWAKNGECQKNKDWMSANCKKSCNTCTNGGSETTMSPPVSPSASVSTSRPSTLSPVTPPPAPCIDKDSRCPQWAQSGECAKNPVWMKANCQKSCRTCNGGGGGGTTGGGGSGGEGTTGGGVSGFAKQALQRHNYYRKIHNAPMMSLDSAMTRSAAAYAYKFASYGTIVHSSWQERGGDGENLAIVCGDDQSATAAVEMWYKEVCMYNFNYGGMSGATGHFTQLVWKESTLLGIGNAPGQYTGWPCTYWVARYREHGNMSGQFQKMVDRGSFKKYSYCKSGR